MDDATAERQLANALSAEERHRVDAVSEITQRAGDEWDVEDEDHESDEGSDRSFGSAPKPQDGEVELNGWNELEWPGMVYRGYWRENHMHGKGMLKSDVGIFSGDFIMHKITGVGRYDFSDGRIYIGEFLDNNFNGQGMLGYDDQTVYEGEFLNGLRHGQGAIVFENGDIYEGGWFEGQRTGPDGDATEGIYVAHDGKEIYQGGFLDNKRHGNGSLWLACDTGNTGRPGDFSKQAVVYNMGKLAKHRARPSCRPIYPTRKPIAALAKARAQNANWGAGAGEDVERPISATGLIKKAAVSRQHTDEDEDDDFDDDDPALKAGGSSPLREDVMDGDEEDQNDGNTAGSRQKTANSGVDEDAEEGETKKKSLIAKVFGPCMPWLKPSEEEVADQQEAKQIDGKPNSIVIVKIEKCVHLPAMVNHETSNPYVELKSRALRQKTQVIKETLDPVFEEKFDMEHNTNDEQRDLLLTVYHQKLGGGKQFLGQLFVDLRASNMGDIVKMKSWELRQQDGVTLVESKDPGSGKTVTSCIFMSWSLSLKAEALVSVRVSNARNINSPDTRGLGFPFVKIKFDDRVHRSLAAKELQHPRWDQSISFDTLSFEQLYILPPHAKPSPKMIIEVWDSKAIGDDIFIGSCQTEISKIRYETRSDMQWHRLTDATRARRANVGEIKFSIAWGPNEPTILTVQIEEGFAITKHLQASLLDKGRRASFFIKNKDDEGKKETLPSPFLKFSLDNTRKRKTRVIKDNISPQWHEKHHFQVLQSELPTSMLVQCFHQHLMGEEFIGMVSVDLQMLELNRQSFVRWYRLQDIELKALADQKKRAIEKAKAKEKALLDGTFKAEDDEEEDLILEEEDEELTSHLHKEKGGFLSRMTGVNNEKARRMQLMRQLNSGKNPEELGRVRIRLSWTSIDDDEEKRCQEIWADRMKNPRKRKLMKKVMTNWIRQYQQQGFEVLKRQAAIQRRMEDEALARYRESTTPRFFSLWQGHLTTMRLQATCLYHYNLRCRQKPFFEAWVFEVDKSRKRNRIKMGLYPGDPDDLPIQAPLEMFNVAGADFLDPVLHMKKLTENKFKMEKNEPKSRETRSKSHAIGSMSAALTLEKKQRAVTAQGGSREA